VISLVGWFIAVLGVLTTVGGTVGAFAYLVLTDGKDISLRTIGPCTSTQAAIINGGAVEAGTAKVRMSTNTTTRTVINTNPFLNITSHLPLGCQVV